MTLNTIFKNINGNRITDFQGRESVVFEVIPSDVEQMTHDEFGNFLSMMKKALSQLPVPEEKAISALQKIFGKDEADEHFYKFYQIEDRLFLNTTHLDLSLPFCEFKNSVDAFDQLLWGDDFHSDVLVKEDYVHFNSKYTRMINLYEMPKSITPFELQEHGDYVVFFKKSKPSEAKRAVNVQRKLHHANLYKTMRNIESEASYQEAEGVVENLILGEEQIFEAESWFVVSASSLEELNQKTKILTSALSEKEIKYLIESVSLSELYPTILYGIEPSFKRSHPVQSSYLTELLPLKKDSLMDEGYQFTTLAGNEVKFQLFTDSSLSFNALFTGVPGSGKSMLAQKVLVEEMKLGAKAIVLDLGNSFRKLSLSHKANIFSERFNPLQFRDPHYMKELIVSVIPEKELSSKLEGKIFKVIEENIQTVRSFRELVDLLETEIKEISLYFAELWEYFTDEVQDITDLTYVDTSKFPDKIKAPLIIYLLEYFKHIKGRKIFVMDEVWSFLEKNAIYIAECFRTFRKQEAAAIALSQTLSEFANTELGRLIVEICHYKFILAQTPSKEVSGLDDFDRERIKLVKSKKRYYSEFYLKTDIYRKILRYYASDIDYVMFTSEQKENNEINKFIEIYSPFFDYLNCLQRFVDFKYHNKGGQVA